MAAASGTCLCLTFVLYATTALVVVTAGFWVLRAHDNPSSLRIAAAGFLCGLAFVTKQDSGALGGAGAFLALVAGHALQRYQPPGGVSLLRKACVFIATAAAPFLLVSLYFLAHGGLGPYLWQTIYDPIFMNALFGSGAGPDAALPARLDVALVVNQDSGLANSS